MRDCVAHMLEDWREWVRKSFILTACKELAKQIIPQIGTKREKKTAQKKPQISLEFMADQL